MLRPRVGEPSFPVENHHHLRARQSRRDRHRPGRGCAFIIAGVAAYGSYQHQREFALHGGADPVSAALWSLSVDGLLLLATVGLLKAGQQASRRVRVAVWLSFLLGIAVSLAANIHEHGQAGDCGQLAHATTGSPR